MRIGVMVVTLSLAASLPAWAQDAAANAQAAPAATQPAAAAPAAPVAEASSQSDLNEIVCKSLPPATGTRLGGGRECHTVREWNERQREDQRMLQQQQVVGAALSK